MNSELTPLRMTIYRVDHQRWSWRLETEHGNHATVVQSGAAYMTRLSAIQGWQRFTRYLRDDAPITQL